MLVCSSDRGILGTGFNVCVRDRFEPSDDDKNNDSTSAEVVI